MRVTIPCTEGRLARFLEWMLNLPSSVTGTVRLMKTMLETADPIWDTFETVYDAGDAGKVSDLISDWWASTGFDAEQENYRKLMNQIFSTRSRPLLLSYPPRIQRQRRSRGSDSTRCSSR